MTTIAAGNLDRLSGPVRQNGPGQRRQVGDRTARGIGLIFTHDPEALLAAVVPSQGDGHAEGCLAFVSGAFDDFRARAPYAPWDRGPRSRRHARLSGKAGRRRRGSTLVNEVEGLRLPLERISQAVTAGADFRSLDLFGVAIESVGRLRS
jgi:hypothetical protein